MKKRSLFAAVAMLVVSAVILTSATYAWFATSASAQINTISSATAKASTGVRLKTTVNAAEWKDTLEASEFTNSSVDKFPTGNNALTPVTSTNGSAFLKYSIHTTNNVDKFQKESTPTLGTDYAQYEFYVGTVNTGDKVTATLTVGGTAAGAARVAVFYTLPQGSETPAGIFSGSDTTYNAITVEIPTDAVTDSNKNAIIDSADTGWDADKVTATPCTAAASGAVPADLSATASTPFVPGQVDGGGTLVRVVYWLEGQDSDCTALISANKTIETSWSFTATAAE